MERERTRPPRETPKRAAGSAGVGLCRRASLNPVRSLKNNLRISRRRRHCRDRPGLADDVRKPASEFDAEGRSEWQDWRWCIRAEAQADAERFGVDVARLHRGRVVYPALRGGPENVGRDRPSALRPAERVRPLDFTAQRRTLIDAERAERIGGGGLRTIERELLCDEERMAEARLRLADQGALQIVGQRLRPGRIEPELAEGRECPL